MAGDAGGGIASGGGDAGGGFTPARICAIADFIADISALRPLMTLVSRTISATSCWLAGAGVVVVAGAGAVAVAGAVVFFSTTVSVVVVTTVAGL